MEEPTNTDRPAETKLSAPSLDQPKERSRNVAKVYGAKDLNKARRATGRVMDKVMTSAMLALILYPMFALAVLNADLSIFWFDGWTASKSLKPSSWMSRADLGFFAGFLVMILMVRRYGAALVAQAQGLAWLALVISVGVMMIVLAPQLTYGDLPSGISVFAMVISWYIGPLVAIHLYDVMRGGRWWRPPLMAGIFGILVQTTLYFPIAYDSTEVPWGAWWMVDAILKMLLMVAFLGIYYILRKKIVPLQNLGGR